MITVWKYETALTEVQEIEMPKGARVLHFDRQGDQLRLWAWVDTDAPLEERKFALVGTGHVAPSPDECEHVGTVLDGPWVWHLFEETR